MTRPTAAKGAYPFRDHRTVAENSPASGTPEGLAWAGEWRTRNKPVFDALYGPEAEPNCWGSTASGRHYAQQWRETHRAEFDAQFGVAA